MPRSGRLGAIARMMTPMQVVSGPIHGSKWHFEAPRSKSVSGEMNRFIAWFNDTAPLGSRPLPALTRAGLTHLYFDDHTPVRRRQWAHRARARGKIPRTESGPPQLDRAQLHDRTQAQGVLRGVGGQQQGHGS